MIPEPVPTRTRPAPTPGTRFVGATWALVVVAGAVVAAVVVWLAAGGLFRLTEWGQP